VDKGADRGVVKGVDRGVDRRVRGVGGERVSLARSAKGSSVYRSRSMDDPDLMDRPTDAPIEPPPMEAPRDCIEVEVRRVN
jgi:hypothetical protein